MHWRIGEAVAAHRPDRLDEIAFHLNEGVLTGDPRRAVDAAVIAGERAIDRVVPELAVLQFERAVASIELTGLVDPERQWEALMGLARAASMTLDMQKTIDSCLAAIDLAERMSWADRVGEAALQATEVSDFLLIPIDTLMPIVDRTLASAHRPLDRIRLLIAGSHLQLQRSIGAARDKAYEAMAIAGEAGEWSWFLEACVAYWLPTSFGLPIEEERALAREMAAAAARDDVVPVRRTRPMNNYLLYGRMGLAMREGDRQGVEAVMEAAATRFFGENRVALLMWTVMLAFADGRLDDVDATSFRLQEEFPAFPVAQIWPQRFRAQVLVERRDPVGLDVLTAAEYASWPTESVLVENYRAAWSPSLPADPASVEKLLDVLHTTGPLGHAYAAEAAARHLRPDWAQRIEPRLRSLRGVYLSGLDARAICPAGRALAQVLLVLGRLDEAVSAAEHAVASDEVFRADALAIRSRQWLAIVLRARGRRGDADRATHELIRAVTEARRLGFVLVAEECQRLLDT